jgi:hypothetical protein
MNIVLTVNREAKIFQRNKVAVLSSAYRSLLFYNKSTSFLQRNSYSYVEDNINPDYLTSDYTKIKRELMNFEKFALKLCFLIKKKKRHNAHSDGLVCLTVCLRNQSINEKAQKKTKKKKLIRWISMTLNRKY